MVAPVVKRRTAPVVHGRAGQVLVTTGQGRRGKDEHVTEEAKAESLPAQGVYGEGLAEVQVGIGQTISTGNFEFLRLDVRVTLPCPPDAVEDTYKQASEKAAEFFAAERNLWMGS